MPRQTRNSSGRRTPSGRRGPGGTPGRSRGGRGGRGRGGHPPGAFGRGRGGRDATTPLRTPSPPPDPPSPPPNQPEAPPQQPPATPLVPPALPPPRAAATTVETAAPTPAPRQSTATAAATPAATQTPQSQPQQATGTQVTMPAGTQRATPGQQRARTLAQEAAQHRNAQLQRQELQARQRINQSSATLPTGGSTSRERRSARRLAAREEESKQASVAAPDSLPGLVDDPSFGGESDPIGMHRAYQAGLMAGREAVQAEQTAQPTQAVQNAQGDTTVQIRNLNDSQWGNVSAIQRIQEEEAGHFATLDGLLDEITDAILVPIAACLMDHFGFSRKQVDLMEKLGFCKMESFIIYGALSVRDMVATVSRRFLREPDLPLALFVARALSIVFHSHAQEQQHNILAVGKPDF